MGYILSNKNRRMIQIIGELYKRTAYKRQKIAQNFYKLFNNEIPEDMQDYMIIEFHWHLLTKNKEFRKLTERLGKLEEKMLKLI